MVEICIGEIKSTRPSTDNGNLEMAAATCSGDREAQNSYTEEAD